MSATAGIKARLLAGDQLTAQIVADDFGVSTSMLSTVIKLMEAEGHVFEKVDVGGQRKGYTLKNPTTNGDGASAESVARMERARKAKGKGRLPELGTELTVVSLNYDTETGDRTIALQAGNQTWFMEVVARP